ncbi:MAG: tRNA pseudouridine(38-40) synthase TruA [Firmicutes bacterium]|nr:tRNA pseudouridine(38-40) synthase TruA [Bacillota bacterium]
MTIAYDGTHFAGWQRQRRARTVQAVLESAIEQVTGRRAAMRASGRTDAGVHALGQVAHLVTASRLPAERIHSGLNALLPPDVVVRAVDEAPPGFHARRDARWRAYGYLILARPLPSALLRRYAHHVPEPLDLDAMQAAATALVGRHDFAAFRVAGTATRTTECTVTEVAVSRRGAFVVITVVADRFLRQMVRRMVATLLQVGRGALPPGAVGALLAAGDPARVPPAAPPGGLYLLGVSYQAAPPGAGTRDAPPGASRTPGAML